MNGSRAEQEKALKGGEMPPDVAARIAAARQKESQGALAKGKATQGVTAPK